MYEEIRITLRIKRSQCEEMYDDLASLGPRLRAFRLRSIALDYYRAKSLPTTRVSPTNHLPASEDSSADDAIIDAFGDELGLSSTE